MAPGERAGRPEPACGPDGCLACCASAVGRKLPLWPSSAGVSWWVCWCQQEAGSPSRPMQQPTASKRTGPLRRRTKIGHHRAAFWDACDTLQCRVPQCKCPACWRADRMHRPDPDPAECVRELVLPQLAGPGLPEAEADSRPVTICDNRITGRLMYTELRSSRRLCTAAAVLAVPPCGKMPATTMDS